MRANPTTRPVLRGVVGLVGLVLVLGGFALVPLPGPGWLVVILGLAVWASEIEPASDLLEWVKRRVRSWEEWVLRQPLWVKGAVALATFVFVVAVLWVMLRLTGVPMFLPDGLEGWLHTTAGL
ncbi:TIGR02611 family protein [Phycicoccus sp. HDW14]|nr:TIGR02611 family protein [Phycicoccus sp. HDW14]